MALLLDLTRNLASIIGEINLHTILLTLRASAWLGMTILSAVLMASGCGKSSGQTVVDNHGSQELPDFEQSLFDFVANTQINNASNQRFNGGWPVHITMSSPISAKRDDTDLFIPLQIGITLHHVAEHYTLPGL